MADIKSAEQRSVNMSHIPSKDTKLEALVRKYLFSKGFRYRKNDKRLPGKPDIVLPKYHTVVFVNGCFWHQHPECKASRIPKSNVQFWAEKLQRNSLRDADEHEQLKSLGWNVIIVWECELANQKKRVSRLEELEK